MANPTKASRTGASPAGGAAPQLGPFFGLLPRPLLRRVKDFFVYTAEFLPLAAGGTATVNTAIQADSDFLIVLVTRVVTDTLNTTFSANVPMLVNVTDAGSGRNLMDRAVHMDNLFGTAQLPSYWPYPKLIRASGTLNTTVQNLDGGNAYNVRMSYLGFKVFGEQERG